MITPSGRQDFKGHETRGGLIGNDYDVAVGTPVFAPANGQVWAIEDRDIGGLSIWLDHGYFYISFFGHLSKNDVKKAGEYIRRGELIGYSGATGRAPMGGRLIRHLHWGVFKNNVWLDPDTLGLKGGRPTYWDEVTELDIKPEHQKIYLSALARDILAKYKPKQSDPLGLGDYIEGKRRLGPSQIESMLTQNPEMFEPDAMALYKERTGILTQYKNMVFSLPFTKPKK